MQNQHKGKLEHPVQTTEDGRVEMSVSDEKPTRTWQEFEAELLVLASGERKRSSLVKCIKLLQSKDQPRHVEADEVALVQRLAESPMALPLGLELARERKQKNGLKRSELARMLFKAIRISAGEMISFPVGFMEIAEKSAVLSQMEQWLALPETEDRMGVISGDCLQSYSDSMTRLLICLLDQRNDELLEASIIELLTRYASSSCERKASKSMWLYGLVDLAVDCCFDASSKAKSKKLRRQILFLLQLRARGYEMHRDLEQRHAALRRSRDALETELSSAQVTISAISDVKLEQEKRIAELEEELSTAQRVLAERDSTLGRLNDQLEWQSGEERRRLKRKVTESIKPELKDLLQALDRKEPNVRFAVLKTEELLRMLEEEL